MDVVVTLCMYMTVRLTLQLLPTVSPAIFHQNEVHGLHLIVWPELRGSRILAASGPGGGFTQ